MSRPLIIAAFASTLFVLPSPVSAQKGMAPSGGKSGGQQCQKGSSQASSMPQAYLMPRTSPIAPYANAGYPSNPSYGPAAPASSSNTTTVTAIHEAFALLKPFIVKLQKEKVDTRAARELAIDFKSAVQIGDSRTLAHAQKEAKILPIMDRIAGNLRTMARDNSLSLAQAMALTEVSSRFQQFNETAQQSNPHSARAAIASR